jgi:hypothetical protein
MSSSYAARSATESLKRESSLSTVSDATDSSHTSMSRPHTAAAPIKASSSDFDRRTSMPPTAPPPVPTSPAPADPPSVAKRWTKAQPSTTPEPSPQGKDVIPSSIVSSNLAAFQTKSEEQPRQTSPKPQPSSSIQDRLAAYKANASTPAPATRSPSTSPMKSQTLSPKSEATSETKRPFPSKFKREVAEPATEPPPSPDQKTSTTSESSDLKTEILVKPVEKANPFKSARRISMIAPSTPVATPAPTPAPAVEPRKPEASLRKEPDVPPPVPPTPAVVEEESPVSLQRRRVVPPPKQREEESVSPTPPTKNEAPPSIAVMSMPPSINEVAEAPATRRVAPTPTPAVPPPAPVPQPEPPRPPSESVAPTPPPQPPSQSAGIRPPPPPPPSRPVPPPPRPPPPKPPAEVVEAFSSVLDPDVDDGLGKYRKLKQLMPEAAVRQRMSLDGFSEDHIIEFLATSTIGGGGNASPSIPTPPPAPTLSKPQISEDPMLFKYRKLKDSLPAEAVRQKMNLDGISANDIDRFLAGEIIEKLTIASAGPVNMGLDITSVKLKSAPVVEKPKARRTSILDAITSGTTLKSVQRDDSRMKPAQPGGAGGLLGNLAVEMFKRRVNMRQDDDVDSDGSGFSESDSDSD